MWKKIYYEMPYEKKLKKKVTIKFEKRFIIKFKKKSII